MLICNQSSPVRRIEPEREPRLAATNLPNPHLDISPSPWAIMSRSALLDPHMKDPCTTTMAVTPTCPLTQCHLTSYRPRTDPPWSHTLATLRTMLQSHQLNEDHVAGSVDTETCPDRPVLIHLTTLEQPKALHLSSTFVLHFLRSAFCICVALR